MEYTILHISDLHKGEGADLSNLFTSLVQDCERYTHDGIGKPSIIVISGDIVNGAEGDNAIAEIRKQYEDVTKFLINLVDYFLDGERKRMIIVPGNHDISREHSKNSMTPSKAEKAEDVKAMWRLRPDLRWSWKDFLFHEITVPETYNSRFSLFVEFYNHFFEGIRTIDGMAEEYSDIVDLPEYGIAFSLFNSCYRLDHLNFSGAICPSAVTRLSQKLNTLYKQGRLLVAVWHHHTMGLPPETNYLDYRILQTMLSYHIHIGLYGHQHKSQVINTYSDIDEEESMLLICSGSLYGQRKELATGYSRQYNLITINNDNGLARLCINARSDQQPDYDIPQWAQGTIGNKGRQSYPKEIRLYTPTKEELLMRVDDKARKTGDYNEAVKELIALGNEIPRYNEYLDEYLSKSNISSEEILNILIKPSSETQALMLIEAALNSDNQDVKNRIKSDLYINMSTSPMVKELLAQL